MLVNKLNILPIQTEQLKLVIMEMNFIIMQSMITSRLKEIPEFILNVIMQLNLKVSFASQKMYWKNLSNL